MQDADDEGGRSWAEACEAIAKNMLKYLKDSEVTKVSTRELKERVRSPNESSVNIVRITRRGEMRKAKAYLQSSDKERTRSSSQGEVGGTL